ncbi:MAG: hypothetical protein F6K31_23435 [Symploca sp. SIO2G7]|nr:hypothetical protein [Symploca sp. SIO2G7]
MDIKKSEKSKKSKESGSDNNEVVERIWKAGEVTAPTATLMLPEFVSLKLKELGERYGISFDLDNISLDGTMAEKVKVIRKISDMAVADSKLLPEMLKSVKKLLRAEISLAKYHKSVSQAALKHQEKVDKTTSELFLKMAGYQEKAGKLELKTNRKLTLMQKRSEAYAAYHENSVFSSEANLIDVEFEVLGETAKTLTEGKEKRKRLQGQRKVKLQQYIDSAYED